jgi:hypothetical protein
MVKLVGSRDFSLSRLLSRVSKGTSSLKAAPYPLRYMSAATASITATRASIFGEDIVTGPKWSSYRTPDLSSSEAAPLPAYTD